MVFTTPYGSLTIEDLNSRGFMVKCFSKERDEEGVKLVSGGSGEVLEGGLGVKTVNGIYCMKKHFSKK